jgi:hypothetical protein
VTWPLSQSLFCAFVCSITNILLDQPPYPCTFHEWFQVVRLDGRATGPTSRLVAIRMTITTIRSEEWREKLIEEQRRAGCQGGTRSKDRPSGCCCTGEEEGRRWWATNPGELRRASDDDGTTGSERRHQAAMKHGLNDVVGAWLPLGRVPGYILVAIVGHRI